MYIIYTATLCKMLQHTVFGNAGLVYIGNPVHDLLIVQLASCDLQKMNDYEQIHPKKNNKERKERKLFCRVGNLNCSDRKMEIIMT